MKTPDRFLLVLLYMLTVLPAISHAQNFGETVIRHGEVDDDLYLAGAQVDLYATVNGDVVVAGGQLNLEGDINADLTAAGGSVTVRSVVADDARLAGGDIRILGKIGDDLVAAGGRIYLSPTARVAGRAWLTGGEIRIDGHVVDELRASGGRMVISGKIDGNVELWAERVIIAETAVITGNLHYKSPHVADIASGVRIDGEVVHTPVDVDFKPVVAQAGVAFVVFLLSLLLTAVVLYLLFPDASLRLSQSLRDEPWQSLGVGLAVFAGLPVLMVILFSTLVGIWLALLLLAVYLVILFTGYLAGAMFVADTGLSRLGKTEVSKVLRAVSLAIALLVLIIVNLIPLVGSLINWAVLLAGIGALSRQLYSQYKA
jgi:cytoskeletal protein CcmA (bactofilin family)